MAVASAGPYANNLHLASYRQPHQHLISQCLQAGCSSWCPTNGVKALKAITEKLNITYAEYYRNCECTEDCYDIIREETQVAYEWSEAPLAWVCVTRHDNTFDFGNSTVITGCNDCRGHQCNACISSQYHFQMSYDQLSAASLIGRNAVTWYSHYWMLNRIGGRQFTSQKYRTVTWLQYWMVTLTLIS